MQIECTRFSVAGCSTHVSLKRAVVLNTHITDTNIGRVPPAETKLLLHRWRCIVQSSLHKSQLSTDFISSVNIDNFPNLVYSSPVVEAPDEGEYGKVVEEGEVAGDEDGDLETYLDCPAQRRQRSERCQQQPRRTELYPVVHGRLEPAARKYRRMVEET